MSNNKFVWLTFSNKNEIFEDGFFMKSFSKCLDLNNSTDENKSSQSFKQIINIKGWTLSAKENGKIFEKTGSFVPLRFCKVPLDKFILWAEETLSLENLTINSGKEFIEKYSSKLNDIKDMSFCLKFLKEESGNFYLAVELLKYNNSTETNNNSDLFIQRLKDHIKDVAKDFGADYIRRFVRNVFDNNKEMLLNMNLDNSKISEMVKEINSELKFQFLVVKSEEDLKSEAFDNYETKFQSRGLYGLCLTKQPKVDCIRMKTDWENIYVNPELSEKEDNDSIIKKLGETDQRWTELHNKNEDL